MMDRNYNAIFQPCTSDGIFGFKLQVNERHANVTHSCIISDATKFYFIFCFFEEKKLSIFHSVAVKVEVNRGV